MTNRKNRHPAFCFLWILNLGSARGSRAGFGGSPKQTSNLQRQIAFAPTRPHLFLDPRNMSGGKLPLSIAPNVEEVFRDSESINQPLRVLLNIARNQMSQPR
jgi:hypothetical protein